MPSTSGTKALALAALLALGCKPGAKAPDVAPPVAEAGVPHLLGGSGPVFPFTVNGSDAGFSPNVWMNAGGTIAGGTSPAFQLYVNKAGSDSNPCAEIAPCLTITHAIAVERTITVNAAQPGVLYVGPGTYSEDVVLLPYWFAVGQETYGFAVSPNNLTLDSTWGSSSSAYGGVDSMGFVGNGTISFGAANTPSVLLTSGYFTGNLTETGTSATGGTSLVLRLWEVTGTTTVNAASLETHSSSFIGAISVASSASRLAGWTSNHDDSVDNSISITCDSTLGQTVLCEGNSTGVFGSAILKGAGTTYQGTDGWVPSTVTRSSGAPVPVTQSPLVGLNSKTAAGANAANLFYPAADGSGNVIWTVPPTSIPLGTAAQFPVMNAGATAYVPVSMSSDCTLASSGAITCPQKTTTLTGPVTGSGTSTIATTISPGTANQIWVTNNNGTPAAGWGTMAGDETFSMAVSGFGTTATVTSAQSGAETFSTTGQISCVNTATQCSLGEADTNNAGASSLTVQAQNSTNASGTGGNLILNGGTASGGTARTPGNIIEAFGIPTGVGTEGAVYFERGNVKIAAIAGYTTAPTALDALWLGPAFTQDIAHTAIYSDGLNTDLNGSASIGATIGGGTGTVVLNFTTGAYAIGSSGSGATLAINGPARTATQLFTSTGFTLNAGQHYWGLPVSINGQAMQIILSQ